jgi:hypothetical protein
VVQNFSTTLLLVLRQVQVQQQLQP